MDFNISDFFFSSFFFFFAHLLFASFWRLDVNRFSIALENFSVDFFVAARRTCIWRDIFSSISVLDNFRLPRSTVIVPLGYWRNKQEKKKVVKRYHCQHELTLISDNDVSSSELCPVYRTRFRYHININLACKIYILDSIEDISVWDKATYGVILRDF